VERKIGERSEQKDTGMGHDVFQVLVRGETVALSGRKEGCTCTEAPFQDTETTKPIKGV
jgi:hypothetical protein